MITISLFDIVNSIDLGLERNIKSYNNSFVDKFIDELKKHLAVSDSMEKLSKLPEDTLFTLDRYEGNYAVCENRTNGKMYDIPTFKVDASVKEGEIMKLENGIYKLDFEETQKQTEISRELTKRVTKFRDI